jgi:hypothetical protein
LALEDGLDRRCMRVSRIKIPLVKMSHVNARKLGIVFGHTLQHDKDDEPEGNSDSGQDEIAEGEHEDGREHSAQEDQLALAAENEQRTQQRLPDARANGVHA